MLIRNLSEVALLLIWASLWTIGGWSIARRAFKLRPNEAALTGLSIGLVSQNWLANLLGQALPLPFAFWLAALLVFLAGLASWLSQQPKDLRSLLKIVSASPWQWLSLAALTLLFTVIGRGLAIFDDYMTLTTTSLIAAGDIPPRFSLDPSIQFGYHHFLLLLAAQLMRIGDLPVWTALDLGRGLTFGLALLLAVLWGQRLTRSRTGGVLTALVLALSGGARWLMLFLPVSFINKIGQSIELTGSAAKSGNDLLSALSSPWAVLGDGPLPFPFAFVSGVSQPMVLNHGGSGSFGEVLAVLLLLTHNRWRGRAGAVVSVILLASLALVNEALFVLTGCALVLVALLAFLTRPAKQRLPAQLTGWLGALLAATVIAAFQGGVITSILTDWIAGWLPAAGATPAYHTFSFSLVWPPTLVTSHLGLLALSNPLHILIALFEAGPVLLVFPLVCVWGSKAWRSGRWYEAAFVLSAFLSLAMTIVTFSGTTALRDFGRAQTLLVPLCKLFAVPLVWLTGARRSELFKVMAGVFGLVAILGGAVLLGIEMLAAPKPVYSYFLNSLDARMQQRYWNRLEPEARIFSPNPLQPPVVFARPSDSSLTWYSYKPEWEALRDAPDPEKLRAAGYDYLYLDFENWDQLRSEFQQKLEAPCLELLAEFSQQQPYDFRRFYDLRDCPAAAKPGS